MAATSIRNIAFDGSTFRFRIGTSAIPVTGVELPEENVKIEVLPFLGEQVPTIRTPGMLEMGQMTVKTTTVVWSSKLLPLLPDVFTDLEFPASAAQTHPTAPGPYHLLFDRVRIIGDKQSVEASEKAGIIELKCGVIQIFHYGRDRTWKGLVRRPGQPAPATRALMF